ncbi:cbb3-type cytochrome oxidase assembly protein CcoS [Pseudotabrizicola algicola]|uniref:Cbb3-type cytochrome oxidase assembly protein CcoS n=1 Tax=Pseudotabrizicola algicola TaxID=2709381 RepID=A0A6B3RSB3_9RHOB|nr:cbb3-type cytochrome oxidase assembly protein CcoS [Pseudotabrizicola algicola]NEX46009.1 cbb3-type cytochrome oxidase assembly protein CcoS [Pseudotabrizicola algicola]
MEILGILIPVSLVLGGLGLAAFFWAMRTKQFDDPEGDANRILTKDYDDKPKTDARPR